jgi:hypothetical protein
LVVVSLTLAAVLAWPGMVLISPQRLRPKRLYLWLLVLALAVWSLIRHVVRVDSCLDSGGSYDYILSQCDMNTSHPYLPMFRTHGVFMVIALTAAVMACVTHFSSSQAGDA